MAKSSSMPRRPLLVSPLQLGDFVLSLPTISALAGRFEEQLGIVATPGTAGLLALVSQKVHPLILDQGPAVPGREQDRLRNAVRGHFDTAVLLGRHRRMRRLLDDVPLHPSRIATFDEFDTGPNLHTHLARRFYRFAEASLGIALPPFPETPAIDLEVLPNDQPLPERYLVVHAGNSSALRPNRFWSKNKIRHRTWPVHCWIDLVERLGSAFSGSIVLTGSRGEAELTNRIIGGLSGPASRRVDNQVGRTSLVDLARILADAYLYIGLDTGPTHLASILGTRTIALFGPTDPKEVGPLGHGDHLKIVRTGIECSPCVRAVRRKCTLNRCLVDLTPRRVLEAAREWL